MTPRFTKTKIGLQVLYSIQIAPTRSQERQKIYSVKNGRTVEKLEYVGGFSPKVNVKNFRLALENNFYFYFSFYNFHY